MKNDIAALINKLSQREMEEMLQKYASEDKNLREEIFSNPSFKDPSFNDLALSEWKRRISDAIDEDLEGDVDEYYASKTVNWGATISVLADAVKDLLKRGQAKDATALIDETEDKTIEASSVEYEEGEYCEIYVEYDYATDDFDKLRFLARSEDKEAREAFFEDCRKAAADGDLKDVWLANYTSPEERSIQLQTILSGIKKFKSKSKPIPYGFLKTAFEMLANLDKRQELREFFEKNSTDRDLRDRMVKWCLEHKEDDYAQEILLEDVRNGGSIQSSDELIKILRRNNETALLKEELLRRIQANLKPEFVFFSELRELLPSSEWKSVVGSFLSHTDADPGLRMKLCGELGDENRLKEIISNQVKNYIKNFSDKYSSANIAAQLALAEEFLKKTDPYYAKNLGKQMVKDILRNPWKRSGYDTLRQVVRVFLDEAEAKDFLEELIRTYPSRHAMRQEFQGKGSGGMGRY